jgi:hypothetical protein
MPEPAAAALELPLQIVIQMVQEPTAVLVEPQRLLQLLKQQVPALVKFPVEIFISAAAVAVLVIHQEQRQAAWEAVLAVQLAALRQERLILAAAVVVLLRRTLLVMAVLA